jgi:phospholipid/cholesterol/gamma-HCH transport system substrate-binding protein
METRANYVIVGLFVVILTVALFAFALWLETTQFEVEVAYYDIYFVGPVTGLKKGSIVSYRGITVGTVDDIEIDPKNLERVIVTIEVQANTPIRRDTVASLEVQGIAGVPFILLSGGTQAAPPLTKEEGQRYPVIASIPSRIEQVLAGAPATVERINILLARANELLSPENRQAIDNTLRNMDKLSETLAAHTADYDVLIRDTVGMLASLREASASLDRLAQRLEADSTRISDRADTALGSINDTAKHMDQSVASVTAEMREAAASAKAMAKEIDAMVAENRQPLRDFSSSTLSEFALLLAETRQLVGSLNRLTTEIERDPARFLFGNRQEGYESKKQ